MDLGTVLDNTTAAVLAPLLLGALVFIWRRAQNRIRGRQLKPQVARRRRRRSLGVARMGHSAEFEIEDISATGAFVRTRGTRRLGVGEEHTLDLVLSEAARISVPVRVVRKQRPSWRKGLIGGVGVAFKFGENDPSKALIEDYIDRDSEPIAHLVEHATG